MSHHVTEVLLLLETKIMDQVIIRYTAQGILTLEPAGDPNTWLVARRYSDTVIRTLPQSKVRALRIMARFLRTIPKLG